MTDLHFVFRKNDNIGAVDADEDDRFFTDCFVDTGDLDVLRDLEDERRIIVGRTGSGKSGLIRRLSETAQIVIPVNAESLALSHVSNSTIIKHVAGLGVNMDTFYRLLWRHVFAVEIIKRRFDLRSHEDRQAVADRIVQRLTPERRGKHRQAIDYLQKWGASFWEETEQRVKQVVDTMESDLKANAKIGEYVGVEAGRHNAHQETTELKNLAQNVVNKVQIQRLTQIIELLDDILDDSQKAYYIVIDRLDENWVDEALRYPLLRALIETVRDFRRVKNAKLIVALRRDLIDRVFRRTADAGFQEEKYESLFLEVSWTNEQLLQALNRRVNKLVRQQYTNADVDYRELLPEEIDEEGIDDFLITRTLMRPRDIIMFFNDCIKAAAGSAMMTRDMVVAAEANYSRGRLQGLAGEWRGDYPSLLQFANLLKARPATFRLDELTDDQCAEFALEVTTKEPPSDPLGRAAWSLLETAGPMRVDEFRRVVARVFYTVGLVGLKLSAFESVSWSHLHQRSVAGHEINASTRVTVHPAFRRTLGVYSAR